MPIRTSRRLFMQRLAALAATFGLSGQARAASWSRNAIQLGWNHPWLAFGHDFGSNAWGHDGLSTNGWSVETFPDSQGFRHSQVVTSDACNARGVLRIAVQLERPHPNRASGEIHVNTSDRLPIHCAPHGRFRQLDMDGGLIRCRLKLPRGSAGRSDAPNGIQFILKTRLSNDDWPALYTPWQNIDRRWEETCVDLHATIDPASAAVIQTGFDARRVDLVGLKMALHSAASGRVQGNLDIVEFALAGDPSVTFAFSEPDFESDVRGILDATRESLGVVRFFVFCDGRAAPEFDERGAVVGLDEAFHRDFQVLLDVAERQQVLLVPVLLDSTWLASPGFVSGVQLGGRSAVIRDPRLRDSFLKNAVEPLIRAYGHHPSILAWDIINEPEWGIQGFHTGLIDRREVDRVDVVSMLDFVRACAALIHSMSPIHGVTVGSAKRSWVRLWRHLGLDFYQFHWYDYMNIDGTADVFPWRPVNELRLDRPCWIGEVPTANTRYTAQEFAASAAASGYAGVLLWSCRARDEASNLLGFSAF